MKSYVKKLIAFFLLIFSSLHLYGQFSVEGSIKEALKFQEIGQHESATKKFLHAYFLDKESVYPELSKRISESFYNAGDTKNALKYIAIYLRNKELSVTEVIESKYYKLRILFEIKQYKEAQASLFQFTEMQIEADPDRYFYYQGLAYIFDQRLEKGRSILSELSYYDQIDQNSLDLLFKRMEKNLDKNHFIASLLSMFVPGLGQLVNGDTKDALNSFLLNAGFLSLFLYVRQTLSQSDAFLSVAPWFGRYYIGGVNNAGDTSKKKQRLREKEYIDELNFLLQQSRYANQ